MDTTVVREIRVQTGWDSIRDEPIYEMIPVWDSTKAPPFREGEGRTAEDAAKVDAIMALLDV